MYIRSCFFDQNWQKVQQLQMRSNYYKSLKGQTIYYYIYIYFNVLEHSAKALS